MILGVDHIVILVAELERASADYAALGFTVVRGGDHPGGATHNALIAFADGSYIELIAFKQPNEQHRWWRRGGEGLIDFALLPGAIAQDVADARARGLEMDGPIDGGRLRPDGQRLEWRTAHSPAPGLPFLCGDITPRELRVPSGDAWRHANGARGVAAISVAVEDIAASGASYAALIGEQFAPPSQPATVAGMGLRVASIQLGATQIALISPSGADGPAGSALREHLAAGEPGPYALALAAAPGSGARTLDPALTHGARIELLPE